MKKKLFSGILVILFLVGSVVGASAVTLLWQNGDPNPVAGYVVAYGLTQAAPYNTQHEIIDAEACQNRQVTVDGQLYDCSSIVPSIEIGATIWLTVKAYNNNADGSECSTCVSPWAAPISYTNNGSGQTGSTPTAPKMLRIEK